MARIIKVALAVILACVLTSSTYAQSAPTLIAPNIFLRGIQLPQGVRYTASFIKPVENAALQNISVEITLPADAQFTEMLVSRQVQFHVVRKNRQHQLTLIWQISRLTADQPLDSFSFSVDQPLPTELEYYMQWQTAEGQPQVEDFFEVPPVVVATQAQAQATVDQPGFVTMGDTGVQVSAPAGSNLSAQVLPINFNPPAQYGNIWWCSLLELDGLPPSTTAEVIMPLRRSLAPFTALQLFQKQADGTWTALAGQGVVTADGQYVIYTHPGGIVATGGPADIQPDAVPASQVPVVEDAPADNPPPAGNNTSADNNAAPPPANNPPAASNNISSDNNAVPPPPADIQPDAVPASQVPVVEDAPADNPPPADNNAAPPPPADNNTSADTSSAPPPDNNPPPADNNAVPPPSADNPQPTAAPNNSGSTGAQGDVTSGQNGSAPTPAKGNGNPAPQPTDVPAGDVVHSGPTPAKGNGNSAPQPTDVPAGDIVHTGATPVKGSGKPTRSAPAATPITIGSTPIPVNTPILLSTGQPGNITDGTSNTIIIGEVGSTPVNNPPSGDGSVRVTPAQPLSTIVLPFVEVTGIATITDGASNTIIIDEATLAPTQLVQPVIETTARGNGNATPVSTTVGDITDGTSNTIIIGEATLVPTQLVQPVIETTARGNGNATPVPTALGDITDGTSNTIIIGEATLVPTQLVQPVIETTARGNGNATSVSTTVGGITDGTSNTIIIGEATLAPTQLVQPVIETTARGNGNPTPVPTALGDITDGTSNTIIVGEKTPAPTNSPLLVTAKATQIVRTPIPPTHSGITDGTSNTINLGEKTPTPVPTVRPTAIPTPIPPVFSPVTVPIITKPFGAGGARVEILTSSNVLLQCQAGQVNCSILNRREGSGKR